MPTIPLEPPWNFLLVFGAFFVALFAVASLLGYWLYRAERRRCQGLRATASQWHFSYTVRDRHFLYDQGRSLKRFRLFSRGSHRSVRILLEGKIFGGLAKVLDYQYERRAYRITGTQRCSALLLTFAGDPLPRFYLRPHAAFDAVADWLGFNDIDFAEHPFFSAGCHLSGEDEGQIRHLFTDDVLHWLQQHHHRLRVEAAGQQLLLYYPDKLTAARATRLLALGTQLLQLLRTPAQFQSSPTSAPGLLKP